MLSLILSKDRLVVKVQANKVPVLRAFERLKKSFISLEPHGFNRGSCQILNFPQTMVEVNNKSQKSIMELVNNLLIEVFSFMAEEERENIKRRQAEGIAIWKQTGKTKTGRPYGRPKIQLPSNWEKVYALWREKRIKSKEAWYLLRVSKNTFYRLVKEYEGREQLV